MQEVTLTVDKSQVWNEVAKATSYTGAKMMSGEDPGAYDRIFTTDQDRELLERYWVEACSLATTHLREWVKEVDAQPIHHGVDLECDYEVTLSVADAWPTALQDSLNASIMSYFVATILSKWFTVTNKGEAEVYGNEAAAYLIDIEKKIYQRKRPTRPT